MEHVVFWSAPTGILEFARVAELNEAVELVERLRNRDAITDATVHSLTDVPVAFRTYYVAEVGGEAGGGLAGSATQGAPSTTVPEPAVDPSDDALSAGVSPLESFGPGVPLLVPDSRPPRVSTADNVGHPTLSVVPDVIDSEVTHADPEAQDEVNAQDVAAEETSAGVDTGESSEDEAGTPSEESVRSLGLFA